jgi:hypothetical protein
MGQLAAPTAGQIVRQTIDIAAQPQLSVRQLARAGEFRAIAQWLNAPLIPQGIFARVAADRPGYLLVLLEVVDLPERDRLNRFIGYRLSQLQSKLIQGVRVVTRYVGSTQVVWDQTIRLRRPAARRVRRISPGTPPGLASSIQVSMPKLPRVRFSRRSRNLLVGGAVTAFLMGTGLNAVNHYIHADGLKTANLETPSASLEGTTPAAVTLTFSGSSSLVNRQALENDVAQRLTPSPVVEATNPSAPVAEPLDSEAPSVTVIPSPEPSPKADLTPVTLSNTLSGTVSDEAAALHTVAPAEGVAIANTSTIVGRSDASGLSKVLSALEKAGIHSVGAGRNEKDARQPEVIDVQGKRVAYLGYSDATPVADFWQAGANPALSDRISEDIEAIRSKVDWVVVSYHWSKELATIPSPEQTALARLAIDRGADLVVGYHPNVLQGAEVYKGRAIAYSLGDFVFPQQTQATQKNSDTAMLRVSLKDDQMRLEFLPVEVKQGKPAIATAEKAQAILNHLKKASALFEQPLEPTTVLDRRSPGTVSTGSEEKAAPERANDSFVAPAYSESEASSTETPAASDVAPATSDLQEKAPAELTVDGTEETKSLNETAPSDFTTDSFTSEPEVPAMSDQLSPNVENQPTSETDPETDLESQ